MAEEHGFQAPEGHRLCANNCGFFGSPTTQNFCSKCYHDLCLNKEADSKANTVVDSLFTLPSSSSSASPSSITPSSPVKPVNSPAAAVDTERVVLAPQAAAAAVAQPNRCSVAVQAVAQPNRCSVCRRKVGLTGFRCRCGITFCGTHRYPEQHGCSFDFKSMGREAIAKANPLIKAEKLEKI